MAFYVGQKVCAIKDDHPDAPPPSIRRGQVVTISEIFPSETDMSLMFQFVECRFEGNATLEPGWHSDGFRPVCDRPTDISLFKAMLNPSKQEVSA